TFSMAVASPMTMVDPRLGTKWRATIMMMAATPARMEPFSGTRVECRKEPKVLSINTQMPPNTPRYTRSLRVHRSAPFVANDTPSLHPDQPTARPPGQAFVVGDDENRGMDGGHGRFTPYELDEVYRVGHIETGRGLIENEKI